MGYHTRYNLSCDRPEIVSAWVEQGRKDSRGFALLPDGTTNEPCKWYEWREELLALSLEHPEVLFTLDGSGESQGDLWRAYFLGGKCYRDEAVPYVFPPFDAGRLA